MAHDKPGRERPWFPLRRQILDSSVWEENPTVRVLWITMLLVASEPGRRGVVDMTVRALAGRACLSPEDTRAALDVLLAPDPASRSTTEYGRRLEALDDHREWGWRIVNWEAYQRDECAMGSTLRSGRHRNATDSNGKQREATHSTDEKEKEKESDTPIVPVPGTSRSLTDTPCGYCGATEAQVGVRHELDHFTPRCEGGGDDPENLILACHRCNQAKSGRLFSSVDEARAWLHRAYWTSNRKRWIDHRLVAFGGQPPPGWSEATRDAGPISANTWAPASEEEAARLEEARRQEDEARRARLEAAGA